MDEALVRELVARILADPRFGSLLTGGEPTAPAVKPAALVIVENSEGLQALPEIQRRLSACCALQLCVAGTVHAPTATLPQVSCEQAMVDPRWSRILLPVCSGRQLVQIATGLRTDKVCDMVAQALLHGIPVELGRVDFGFTPQTPAAYRQLLEGYLKQVSPYGVTLSALPAASSVAPAVVASKPTPATPLPWTFGEPVVQKEPETRSDMIYDKNLMTEKEAMLFPEHALVQLRRATVLTPSAIDTLKRQKVQVYREGVRVL